MTFEVNDPIQKEKGGKKTLWLLGYTCTLFNAFNFWMTGQRRLSY